MKRLPLAFAAVVAACVLFVAACGGSSPAADEAAIGEANAKWLAAIVAKDAAAIDALHAEDAQMFPPNAPKVVGREAIQKGWGDMVSAPGMTLTFETEKVIFAKSGEMAIDIRTYKFAMGEGAAAINDSGKSVVTWTKRDGKWLVLTDMFSSDLPVAPPPAAPAPTPEATSAAPVDGTTPPAAPDGATPAPAPTPAPETPATPAPATPPGTP